VTAPGPTSSTAPRTHPTARWSLVVLEVLIAANAYFGGIGLIRDGMGMPDAWLESTPFDSWVLPGIALLLVIAVPMTIAAALEITESPYAYRASVAVGVVQMLWILAQLVVLRQFFFLQPLLFVLGATVVALAWLAHRRPTR
jgi:hypothetical protein